MKILWELEFFFVFPYFFKVRKGDIVGLKVGNRIENNFVHCIKIDKHSFWLV